MRTVGYVIELVLQVFILLLFVRLIVDWIQMFARQWTPRGPVLVILEGVYTVTDPPIRTLRRFIPPLRVGAIAIDFAFALTMLLCFVLLGITGSLARA